MRYLSDRITEFPYPTCNKKPFLLKIHRQLPFIDNKSDPDTLYPLGSLENCELTFAFQFTTAMPYDVYVYDL